jgi:ribonuclease HI
MGKFFDHATAQGTLKGAWGRIRQNGIASPSQETRSQITHFDQDPERNIRRIQAKLRRGEFQFDPQQGVLKQKASGNGKRGIVMASVQNRIVERALLNSLQAKSPFIQQVLEVPTSVGGVPHRSVPHGLRVIEEAFKEGKLWFARSDISGFFDGIPRDAVLAEIAKHVDDPAFLDLLARATTVVLANERALGDDRRCFPTDKDGVAQGSPLSPLFGNILLHDFDQRLNGRGIVTPRFIDDFAIFGHSPSAVAKAFASAHACLDAPGLKCHDPFADGDRTKSAHGHASIGFDFLGYRIEPGLFQPSSRARKKLLAAIDEQFRIGRHAIGTCLREQNSLAHRQRAPQTIDMVDRIVKGWGNAFSYGNSKATLADLDRQIDERNKAFRAWYANRTRALDEAQRRRAGGICQLVDIPTKRLDELPFRLSPARRRFRRSKTTITISTDGSVLGNAKRRGRDQGPGGWAYVVHGSGRTASGSCAVTTNNHMELLAVVMALRASPEQSSVEIRTDSQYVASTFNTFHSIQANVPLWHELDSLVQTRAVRIEWIRGHAGDPYNERVDKLAREAALSITPERATPVAA